jgi:all-beta uncharacterized protein
MVGSRPIGMRLHHLVAITYATVLLVSCSGPTPNPTPAPSPTPSPSILLSGACGYSVNQAATNLTADAGGAVLSVQVTIAVTSAGNCSWTVSVNEDGRSFIAVTEPNGGATGNATVKLTIAPNTQGERRGTLTIANVPFTVTQQAAPCMFALSGDTNAHFGAGGGSGTIMVSVTQGANCSWAATSSTPFITVTSGSSGTGDGAVMFRVAANPGGARMGILIVAGQPTTVAQDAAVVTPPSPPITPSLAISFSPDPAPFYGQMCPGFPSLGTNTWRARVTVRETNGGGFVVGSFANNFIGPDGRVFDTVTYNSFTTTFAGCGATAQRIPPNGMVCSDLCWALPSNDGSGGIQFVFSGSDDSGHPLTFTSAVLRFLSR